MTAVRIAGLQTPGTPGDVRANIAELDRAAADAVAAGARILITPELFVTGYDIGDAVDRLARLDLVGPVQEIARTHGIAIVLGAPERADDHCYNSAYFVDDHGRIVARYRKTHLFGELDRQHFTAGDELVGMVEYAGLRIAMLICYDVEFPEAVRAAACAGADLVVVPTAQMVPFDFVADHVIRVRAWENQLYIAYVNHSGTEDTLSYVGHSSIVAPSGEVLARAGDDTQLLVADIDPDRVAQGRRDNPYLLDRRAALYGSA